MAILQTPTIYTIPPFDPGYENTIEFFCTDSQPYKNRIVITDNMNGDIVYDKTSDTMRLYAVIPKNTLLAGRQYLAQIQVFDFDGESSNLSDPVMFYCFTEPVFHFQDISDGDMYKNASISPILEYSQEENEPLKSYQLFIYGADKTSISSSNVFYSSITPYTFYGLENNTSYFIRAAGETLHGMTLDTGYIGFFVDYNTIPANIILKAENNYHGGYIQIETNIISIGYEVGNDNYKIENGMLTLEDNYLLYNEGFNVDGDFSLFIEAKKLPIGKFLTMNSNCISLDIIKICASYYCQLIVKDSDAVHYAPLPKARLCSDDGAYISTDDGKQIEIIDTSYDDDELIVFEVKRINGIYSLNAYYKAERMV